MKRRSTALAAALLLGGAASLHAANIELLGEATVAREVPGVSAVGVSAPIGGLSAIVYDPTAESYYALSDDPGQFAPPRLYRLTFDLTDGALTEGEIRVVSEVELRTARDEPIPARRVDPEGLARSPSGGWWVASEGHADAKVPPALIEFSAEGRWLGEMRLPRRLRPRRKAGVRHNLALESVTISPDGRWLFTATESALKQDGDPAGSTSGSPSRLLRFDLERRRHDASFVYWTEPLATPPAGDEFAVNGLVDLLALGNGRLLALERSYTAGHGNTVRLFEVDLTGADEVSRVRRLGRTRRSPVAKRLLVDIGTLGVQPDNLEGLTWGPELEDGRRTLVLVADDNFNPPEQRSQVIALAFGDAPSR